MSILLFKGSIIAQTYEVRKDLNGNSFVIRNDLNDICGSLL